MATCHQVVHTSTEEMFLSGKGIPTSLASSLSAHVCCTPPPIHCAPPYTPPAPAEERAAPRPPGHAGLLCGARQRGVHGPGAHRPGGARGAWQTAGCCGRIMHTYAWGGGARGMDCSQHTSVQLCDAKAVGMGHALRCTQSCGFPLLAAPAAARPPRRSRGGWAAWCRRGGDRRCRTRCGRCGRRSRA